MRTGMEPSDLELKSLAERLGHALGLKGWRVATAESCTGGWIAKAMTDVPGSSGWFNAGFVTYSNDAKTNTLDVPERLIDDHGAVSEVVVCVMAKTAIERSGAELAVAVSGVAGPAGGTAEKPVGTVWFAWASPRGIRAERCQYSGTREAIRRLAVSHALEGLLSDLAADA